MMSKIILAAGAAALAMAAPALAQKHGNGGDHGGGHAEQQHGNGGGHGKPAKAGNPGAGKSHVQARGNGNAAKPHLEARGNSGHGEVKGSKGPAKAAKIEVRDVRNDRDVRVVQSDRVFPRLAGRSGGLVEGCPPGLAMKGNGCMPPGQFKKVGDTWANAARAQALTGPYSQWYRDNDRYLYRMGDGVLYQINRSNNLIDALIPYGMRDYSYYPVGYTYPDIYNSYNVPYAYRSFYPDGGDSLYRYGGNAIYAIDPQTQVVNSIVSLLAGDLSVGQPLPSAYNVYNVPLAYRNQYYDTPDNWYRYNDGSIYRVDPTTQLVTAVINALV
jgi:hypothetical protein